MNDDNEAPPRSSHPGIGAEPKIRAMLLKLLGSLK